MTVTSLSANPFNRVPKSSPTSQTPPVDKAGHGQALKPRFRDSQVQELDLGRGLPEINVEETAAEDESGVHKLLQPALVREIVSNYITLFSKSSLKSNIFYEMTNDLQILNFSVNLPVLLVR